MTSTLLKRGAKVWVNGSVETVEHAGVAGFSVRNRLGMLLWSDRGKTWDSDDLDRIDEARAKFQQAAKEG